MKFPDTNFLFHTSYIGIDPELPFDLSTCFLLTIFCLGISESNAQDNFAGLFCAFFHIHSVHILWFCYDTSSPLPYHSGNNSLFLIILYTCPLFSSIAR